GIGLDRSSTFAAQVYLLSQWVLIRKIFAREYFIDHRDVRSNCAVVIADHAAADNRRPMSRAYPPLTAEILASRVWAGSLGWPTKLKLVHVDAGKRRRADERCFLHAGHMPHPFQSWPIKESSN